MTIDRVRFGWSLWSQWVLASAIGATVAALVARRVSLVVGGAAGHTMGGIVAEAVTGGLALGGMMLGVAIPQWLVVRRHVSWGVWLVLATVSGGALGGAVILGVWAALAGLAGQAVAVILGGVVGLNVFGLAQWLVLRRQVSWAAWWSAASVAGLIAAWLGVILIAALIGGKSDALLGVGFGAAYGTITGVGLVRLQRPA